MTWISYAQNREDVLLARAFAGRSIGFWIDVGAHHPVTHSVTKHFSDLGWHGINIDASPEAHRRLAAARSRDVNLNIGVSDQADRLTFHQGLRARGLDASGMSTFVREHAEQHRRDGFTFEERTIEVLPLAEICRRHVTVPVDFLSIDVEGHEEKVLRGADFVNYRPRIVLIEATRPRTTERTHQQWEHLVLDARYLRAGFDGLNQWYVREEDAELLEILAVPPNVFDEYVPWEYHKRLRPLDAISSAAHAARKLMSRVGGRLRTGSRRW
jgi:FkbM family methyltransferase